MIAEGDKATIADIVRTVIPADRRKEFDQLYLDAPNGFFVFVNDFLSPEELREAVSDWVCQQLTHMQHFCGVRIDAIVEADGQKVLYGDLFSAYGI